ncbi:MAG: hypothetical protein ACJAT2_000931 [Bacteriovoracaceae bacterium]|jgi:hypothetical protein
MLKKLLYLILIFSLFTSCGATDEEEVEDAIFNAQQLLTSGLCSEALEVLIKIPYQPANDTYIKTLASAQACLGGYNTTVFFDSDLAKLGTAQTAFLGSLATFSTSNMTQSNSSSYQNIFSAIKTLTLAGGLTNSSYAGRTTAIGAIKNNNISVFALYTILVELGKFLNYYGNADDTTGVKGTGGQANVCYFNYTNGTAVAAVSGSTSGSCDHPGSTAGHPSLVLPANADTRERACEGIVLFNNFLDIIANITFSGTNSGDLNDLKSIAESCSSIPGVNSEICTTKTVASCVSDTTNITDVQFELYYSVIFENMHL